MVFHWSLSDSKSPRVSRTTPSFLAVFHNAVVGMVYTRPPTSNSSRPFNNSFVTVPKAQITIGRIVPFMFHSFFNSLARLSYLPFFSRSFSFFCCQLGQQSRRICKFSFFFCLLVLGLVFWTRLNDPCECQSPIGVYASHFLGLVLGCAYTICWYGQI